MAYSKTNWQNSSTPVNATNLNHIEQGVYDNSVETETLNENITNLSGTILWTNPNPTDAFASQTITLSSSDYDILEIFYIDYQNTQRMMSERAIKGKNILLNSLFLHNNLAFMGSRNIDSVSNTSLLFGNCWKIMDSNSIITPDTANNWIIPQYIVGYKTGLFS